MCLQMMSPILNSWKQVSTYLGTAVRTIQRWEKDHALPIYRNRGAKRGPVFAYTSELDSWLHGQGANLLANYRKEDMRQNVVRLRVLRSQMRHLMQNQRRLVAELSANRALRDGKTNGHRH